MRKLPWMTAVAGALMWLAIPSPTSAQSPYDAPGYAPGGPPGYAIPPEAYGTLDPNAIYPPGLIPQDFQPWPQVSPYHPANVQQEQTYNQGGLWFKDMVFRRRKWTFSVEALAMQYRDAGNAFIGSPISAFVDWDLYLQLGQNQDPDLGPFVDVNVTPIGNVPGFFLLNNLTYPYPSLAATDGTITANVSLDNFPVWGANKIDGLNMNGGLQLRLASMNEDHTGVMINGWWGSQVTSNFTKGRDNINGFAITQEMLDLFDNVFVSPTYGNIPLQNGEPLTGLLNWGTGSTAKYDVLYDLRFTTEAAGTNISFYNQPLYRTSAAMLRPMYGLRYLYLHENMKFHGIDSGLNYDIDEDSNRPAGAPTVVYDLYHASLNSDVESHIAGPEVGLRFDLGHSNGGFKVWGESIFGLAANNENIRIHGDNIGDPLTDVRINGAVIPRMLDPLNVSEFDNRKTVTHVSPTMQHSIFADMDIFGAIPLLRDVDLLEESTFRLGYTFIWVGAVARPADTINWQGFPLYPDIRSNRQSWYAHQLNMSLDMHF